MIINQIELHEKELEDNLNELLFEWFIDRESESFPVVKKCIYIEDTDKVTVGSWQTTDCVNNT